MWKQNIQKSLLISLCHCWGLLQPCLTHLDANNAQGVVGTEATPGLANLEPCGALHLLASSGLIPPRGLPDIATPAGLIVSQASEPAHDFAQGPATCSHSQCDWSCPQLLQAFLEPCSGMPASAHVWILQPSGASSCRHKNAQPHLQHISRASQALY